MSDTALSRAELGPDQAAIQEIEARASSALPARPAPGLAVTVQGLGKSFGAKRVLEGVDLQVQAGQFVAVIGKSGCGKSTLLRLVVGLETPSQGHLTLGDAHAGATRIMFQEPRLLPWARVLANVEVGL